MGSVVAAILSFLGKAVGSVAEHTLALIIFVAGLNSVWLIQKVKKSWVFSNACFIKPFVFLTRPDLFNTFLRYSVSHNATFDNSEPL